MEDIHIQDLKKKIDHLEYDEINPLKDQVNSIRISLSNNDLLTNQIITGMQNANNTIDMLKSTMIEIAQSIKDSNKINNEITKTMEEMNKKIASIETNTNESLKAFGEKIEEIDDKSKFDILVWLKTNWFGIIGIGGLLYTLIKGLGGF